MVEIELLDGDVVVNVREARTCNRMRAYRGGHQLAWSLTTNLGL
jgi:hypothetical protein